MLRCAHLVVVRDPLQKVWCPFGDPAERARRMTAGRFDRMTSRCWQCLAVGFSWAGLLMSKASSFCLYKGLHILAEAGALPTSEGIHVPDSERTGVCVARKCPDARHCSHYYTDYPATCCDCEERFG